jgi:hypothetical protein
MNTATAQSAADLYEQDFYAWTEAQAALLKAGRLGELDLPNLLEEIESMGISQRAELKSRLRVLLMHLLKWRFQPEARSSGWKGTINEQRICLELLLETSPSLVRFLPEDVPAMYSKARRIASDETGLPLATFPETCPFTVEQVLDLRYRPD